MCQFLRTRMTCRGITTLQSKLQRNKVDEVHNEIIGKSSGSQTKDRSEHNEGNPRGLVSLQGADIKEVEDFKCCGSTVQSNGGCGKDVKKSEQAGWNGW